MSEKQKKNVAVNGAVSQAAGEGKQPERVMTNKMGTIPLFRPNTGMNTKLCTLK